MNAPSRSYAAHWQFGLSVDFLRFAVDLERELAAVKAERDALRDALCSLMNCAGRINTAPDTILEEARDDEEETPETREQAIAAVVSAVNALEGE
jgi:hypothetical protein